jgi:hypothetical protein
VGVVTGSVLRWAAAYAAAGWPVFPIRPDDPSCPGGPGCDCKAPLTANGFKDAVTDRARIHAWWQRWPRANVAIATGTPGPDVLDVDVKPDGSGFPAFNRLKQAGVLTGARALVRTPSGGLHAYFTGTGQPSGRLPRHYLDFKAAGGYVLAPPSMVHGKRYELLDHRRSGRRLDWQLVRQLLDPPQRGNGLPRGAGDAERLAAWVAAQPEGNRNAGLYWAARRAVESGLDPDTLAAAAVHAGLSETEAHRTIGSAKKASR